MLGHADLIVDFIGIHSRQVTCRFSCWLKKILAYRGKLCSRERKQRCG